MQEKRKRLLAWRLANFLRRYARKARTDGDPNDRQYDRRFEERVKRMSPEELDVLMHGEVEDENRGQEGE